MATTVGDDLGCTPIPSDNGRIGGGHYSVATETTPGSTRRDLFRTTAMAAATTMVSISFGAGPAQATDEASTTFERRIDKNPKLYYTIKLPTTLNQGQKPVKTHLDEVNFISENIKGYQLGITVDPVRINSLKEVRWGYTIHYWRDVKEKRHFADAIPLFPPPTPSFVFMPYQWLLNDFFLPVLQPFKPFNTKIEKFGTPEEVAARVVTAEVNRDGIFEVTLLQDPYQSDDGAYILEYLSVGKRGNKHLINKIFIANNLLYVLTAQAKEETYKEDTFNLPREMMSSVSSFTV